MTRLSALFVTGIAAMVFSACGENMESPNIAVTFGPPQNLGAVSQSASSVTLHWQPGIGAEDSTFLGYIVVINGVEDSIPKTQLGYLADSLPPGPTFFTVHSYQSDGPRSDAATITWAPADRIELNAIVTEYFNQAPTRLSAFTLGSQTRDPMSLPVTLSDTNITRSMDLLLHGSNGVVEFPLALWGAHLFQVGLRVTKFSTISDSAANLDFARTTFPDEGTFVADSVVVLHNRIYYLRVAGDSAGDTLYARIHVTITPNRVFPNREVIINVSLQRIPGVPFAVQSISPATLSPILHELEFQNACGAGLNSA
jgi:hypothetical protein